MRVLGSSPTIALLASLVACGRVGFDPPAAIAPDGGRDAAVDAGSPRDGGGGDAGAPDAASGDAGVVDGGVLGPFGPPVAITELNTSDAEDDPTLTADRLEIVFASDSPMGMGSEDLWTATRARVTDPWSELHPIVELNSAAGDSAPRISRDGLALYFDSSRSGGAGGLDVWMSSRSSRTARWAPPVRVAELASSADDAAAATDVSMAHMVLYSTRAGGAGSLDLYGTTSTAGSWATPVALTEINTPREEAMPWLGPRGLVLYFASDRVGGMGRRDIYRTTRPTTSAPFDTPVPVEGINSTGADTDPWVSDDERVIVFARGGALGDDLYEATR